MFKAEVQFGNLEERHGTYYLTRGKLIMGNFGHSPKGSGERSMLNTRTERQKSADDSSAKLHCVYVKRAATSGTKMGGGDSCCWYIVTA